MTRVTASRILFVLFLTAIFTTAINAQNAGTGLYRASSGTQAPKIAQKREAMRAPAVQASLPDCDPHPGTVVSCQMSLQEAVNSGMAQLSSKGLISGDEVAITIDNTQPPPKCNTVHVQLFIEFYGPAASDANVQLIKDAIESLWNGRTSSDGRQIQVEVVTRTAPGVDNPPGTKGFHEIKLVDTDVRDVVNGMGTDFDINRGTGSAEWSAGAEDNVYAHEAGHLMMFPDYYDDYDKLPDGTWQNQSNNQIVTADQLADWLVRTYPNKSLAERKQLLDNTPVGKGVSLVQPGHEGDLMGSYVNGAVQLPEIDAIAAHADGIVVTVDPGEVMVSKDPSRQSVVITHAENIFVPSGETKTCGGLYASCIDGNKLWSDLHTGFDLAPPLGEWPPNAAAALLLKLARYIDTHALYEGLGGQEAIWRLTDNEGNYLAGGGDILWNAGIRVRDSIYYFVHPVDPDSSLPNSVFTIPPQVVEPRVTPAAMLVQPGARIRWSGSILRPASTEKNTRYSWTLGKPDSSSAALANPGSDTLDFTADKRGLYLPLALISRTGFAAYPSARGGVLVAADAMTETFESGTLRRGAPFFWGTTDYDPWVVSDSDSFTGRYALRSTNRHPFIDSTSDLGVKITIPAEGDISFAYRAGSGIFIFNVDGNPNDLYAYDKLEKSWQYASYHLAAGTHTLVWIYSGCTPADSSGAMTETGAWLDDVFFPPSATLIRTAADEIPAPAGFSLAQNYPNPFGASTRIAYSLASPQQVTLILYDALGHEIRRLVDQAQSSGAHSVRLDAAGLARGAYFYRLTAGSFSAMKGIVVLNNEQ